MRYTRFTLLLAVAVATGIGVVALRRATGQGETPAAEAVVLEQEASAEATAASAEGGAAQAAPGQPLSFGGAAPGQPAAEIAPPRAAAPVATPAGAGGFPGATPTAEPNRGPVVVDTGVQPGRRAAGPINAYAPNPGGGFAPVIHNGTTVYQAYGPLALPVQGGWGGEPDPEAVQLHASDAQLGQAAEALIQQYGQTEDEQQRNNLKEQLGETLAKQFDVQQQLREHEIAKIEAKVKKLRDIITKRTDARKSIIERRLDQLLREADGLGWNSPANPTAHASVVPRYVPAPAGAIPAPPGSLPQPPASVVPAPPGGSGGKPGRFQLLNQDPPATSAAPAASTPPSRPGASAVPASVRQKAIDNMKQIMLALVTYADVNGHYPPPVLTGPDGKTSYSWRVAILPYLEQTSLYERYKFDEPWDSDSNQQVLEQMPAVLRDPTADPKSKDTSYYALVGAETCFGERGGKGTSFAEILDGTSNTILVVEAKRDVPWTKPEDIVYDSAQPTQGLGGIRPADFLAGFADGAVRELPKTIDANELRKLITRAGGESVFLVAP